MSREHIFHKVRTALGRGTGQPPAPAPPVRLRTADLAAEDRVSMFLQCVEGLVGKTYRASSGADACAYVAAQVEGRNAVASNAPFLCECGITNLPAVVSGLVDRDALRAACAVADIGITSADYALAETGTLVMLSSPQEARMISLLPPVHIAVVPRQRILTSLDELLTILPKPAEQTSSMVLITGPSRTADIEQILVRGVHGPGEIHVVVV